jgi:hypothetical protein
VLIRECICCIVIFDPLQLADGRFSEGRMIKDTRLLAEFEDMEVSKEKPDYPSALRIFEAMWKEAMLLGVLPLKDPLEGIEVDIQIARILNDVRAAH